jgi:hypothetical protein
MRMDDGFVELLNLKTNFTLINFCPERMNNMCVVYFIGQLEETRACFPSSLTQFWENYMPHLMEFRN